MKLTIESTSITTNVDGVRSRLWRGKTADGRDVDVYVHRVAADDPAVGAVIAADLTTMMPPLDEPRYTGTMTIQPEWITSLVARSIEASASGADDDTIPPAQHAVRECIARCYAEGEVGLAAAVMFVSCMRSASPNGTHDAVGMLMQWLVDRQREEASSDVDGR